MRSLAINNIIILGNINIVSGATANNSYGFYATTEYSITITPKFTADAFRLDCTGNKAGNYDGSRIRILINGNIWLTPVWPTSTWLTFTYRHTSNISNIKILSDTSRSSTLITVNNILFSRL